MGIWNDILLGVQRLDAKAFVLLSDQFLLNVGSFDFLLSHLPPFLVEGGKCESLAGQ